MRHHVLSAAILAVLAAGGCNWTDFDNLKDTVGVQSTGKPGGVKSSDYGVALLEAQHAGSGGELAVVGIQDPTVSTLHYATTGDATLGTATIDLHTDFTIDSLPDPPPFVEDPTSDNIALVVPSNDGRTAVLYGAADALVELTIADPSPTTGAFDANGQLLVLGLGSSHAVDPTSHMSTSCAISDDATTPAPLDAVAAAFAGDSLVVVSSTGKLLTFDGSAALACDAMAAPGILPTSSADLGYTPDPHTRIIPLDTGTVLVVGVPVPPTTGDTSPSDQPSTIGIYDATTGAAIGAPFHPMGVQSAAVGSIGGSTYLAVGLPSHLVGDVNAGEVDVYALDLTAHTIASQISVELNDAQPEDRQTFGRAVTFMHFNDDSIIVVSGDNEIYSYYETALYTDVRK